MDLALYGMDLALKIYVGGYLMACVIAVVVAVRDRQTISLFSSGYREFMAAPWKTTSFAVAAIGMTWIAPYTGDPTWDYFDAAFMSLLTFASAPWAIGTLYLFLRRKISASHAYVAMCCWLFSASWSYDLYILLRDGQYPITWLPNIFAASVLYISAGLMWNLEWRQNRGVIFAFMEKGWPQAAAQANFIHIFGYAMPFMILVAASILYFVL